MITRFVLSIFLCSYINQISATQPAPKEKTIPVIMKTAQDTSGKNKIKTEKKEKTENPKEDKEDTFNKCLEDQKKDYIASDADLDTFIEQNKDLFEYLESYPHLNAKEFRENEAWRQYDSAEDFVRDNFEKSEKSPFLVGWYPKRNSKIFTDSIPLNQDSLKQEENSKFFKYPIPVNPLDLVHPLRVKEKDLFKFRYRVKRFVNFRNSILIKKCYIQINKGLKPKSDAEIIKELKDQQLVASENLDNYTQGLQQKDIQDPYALIRKTVNDVLKQSVFIAEYYLFHDKKTNSQAIVNNKEVESERHWQNIMITNASERIENNKYVTEVHHIKTEACQNVESCKKQPEYLKKSLEPIPKDFYSTKDDTISAVIFKPMINNGQHPIAIFNHGGGPDKLFLVKGFNPIVSVLINLGYVVICPNYRGGDFHEKDMNAVINYITSKLDNYVNPDKIVLTGISSGTTLTAKILGTDVIKKLAGIFLHTVIVTDSNLPGLIKSVQNLKKDLPLLLVSGREDYEGADKLGTAPFYNLSHYITALKNKLKDNFSFYIVEHGGHQLIDIQKKRSGTLIDNPLLEYKKGQKKILLNKDMLNDVYKKIKNDYNLSEMEEYLYYLTEFLYKVGYEDLSGSHKYTTALSLQVPDLSKIVNKALLNREIKGRHARRVPGLIEEDGRRTDWVCSPTFAHLSILLEKTDKKQELCNPKFIKSAAKEFWELFQKEKDRIEAEFKKAIKKGSKNSLLTTKTEFKEVENIVEKILTKETDDTLRGTYVLYHGANDQAGFGYEIYTHLKNLVNISSGEKKTKFLRILDEHFFKYLSSDNLIIQTRNLDKNNPDTIFNYQKGFPEVALSAQWFLFGSYNYWFSSTFLNYFFSGNTNNDFNWNDSLKEVMANLFQKENVKKVIAIHPELKDIIKRYEEIFKKYKEKKGTLVQIFISPLIIDEVAYVSETLGYPLELKINGKVTHKPSEILGEMFKDPLSFEKTLETRARDFKHHNQPERKDFFPTNKVVNSLEARFFMKPEYMADPTKIQTYIYHYPAMDNEAAYEKELSDITIDFVKLWLGADTAFSPARVGGTPNLIKLKEFTEKDNLLIKEIEASLLTDNPQNTLEIFLRLKSNMDNPKDITDLINIIFSLAMKHDKLDTAKIFYDQGGSLDFWINNIEGINNNVKKEFYDFIKSFNLLYNATTSKEIIKEFIYYAGNINDLHSSPEENAKNIMEKLKLFLSKIIISQNCYSIVSQDDSLNCSLKKILINNKTVLYKNEKIKIYKYLYDNSPLVNKTTQLSDYKIFQIMLSKNPNLNNMRNSFYSGMESYNSLEISKIFDYLVNYINNNNIFNNLLNFRFYAFTPNKIVKFAKLVNDNESPFKDIFNPENLKIDGNKLTIPNIKQYLNSIILYIKDEYSSMNNYEKSYYLDYLSFVFANYQKDPEFMGNISMNYDLSKIYGCRFKKDKGYIYLSDMMLIEKNSYNDIFGGLEIKLEKGDKKQAEYEALVFLLRKIFAACLSTDMAEAQMHLKHAFWICRKLNENLNDIPPFNIRTKNKEKVFQVANIIVTAFKAINPELSKIDLDKIQSEAYAKEDVSKQ